MRGNGHHVAEFEGVTYLFASEDNKKKFEGNATKYIPAYGGYCAFGVTEEKKFVGVENRRWETLFEPGQGYLS